MQPPLAGLTRKLVLLVVVGLTVALAVIYQIQNQVHSRAKTIARQELSAIANLKLRHVSDWRRERLADARFVAKARFVSRDVQALIQSESPETRSAVEHWLGLLRTPDRYEFVAVLDREQKVRCSLPGDIPRVDHLEGLWAEAASRREVVMSDLFEPVREEGEPRMDILIPIYADPDTPAGEPVGAVLMRLDPDRLLFPLIQSWPGTSRTGEVLLVRREGEDVLYLNTLRHRENAAFRLKQSIHATALPAAAVINGRTHVQEGVDYRGHRVVFAGGFVADTSWALIVKIDEDELYAGSRQKSVVLLLVGSSVLLFAVLLVSGIWQRRNALLLAQLRVQAAALRSADNGILITKPDSTIEWANPAVTKLTGYEVEELVGKKPNLFKSGRHTAEFYRHMWSTILAGRSWRGELVNRRKDGSLYHEEMTVTPVLDPKGAISQFVAITQDVTHRKELEERLARDRDELEQVVQQRTAQLRETVAELEHFSYSITHDMRAPLRAMNTYVVMLERKHGRILTDEALDYLARIRISASRMDHLIRDALNYAKLSRAELPLCTIDLGPLLRGILNSYPNLQVASAEITLEFEHLLVIGNEAGLTQCFSNLLGNAVKFVAPGVLPRVQVLARETRDPSGETRVRIAVRDNGIGIPEGSQETIFGMFQRLHQHDEYPGTGIGLSLVRKVVQRMGGTTGVISTPGRGSEFWIELRKGEPNDEADHSSG